MRATSTMPRLRLRGMNPREATGVAGRGKGLSALRRLALVVRPRGARRRRVKGNVRGARPARLVARPFEDGEDRVECFSLGRVRPGGRGSGCGHETVSSGW